MDPLPASKGGLDSLTAGLSKEVATDGIRVNKVRPGLMASDFGPWTPDGRTERLRPGVPMRRAGDPDEIAAAIVAATRQGAYVTGAILDVGRPLIRDVGFCALLTSAESTSPW